MVGDLGSRQKIADGSHHFSRYEFLSQIGAGPDGASYRARDRTGHDSVECCILTKPSIPSSRWVAGAKKLRLAALLDHDAARRVLELDLHGEPPFVCLEWDETASLRSRFGASVPLPLEQSLATVLEIAEGLAAAHRLGLSHDRLNPATILLDQRGNVKLDFNPFDTRAAQTPYLRADDDDPLRASEPNEPRDEDPASDVLALGRVLAWMLTGDAAASPETIESYVTASLESLIPTPDRRTDMASEVGRLLQAIADREPTERPTASEVAGVLRKCLLWFQKGTGAVEATHEVPNAGVQDVAATFEADTMSAASAGVAPSQAGTALPRQLGRFRLLEKLGEGGMGTAYKAEDLSDGTLVAVKTLRAELARQPNAVQRFQKEARLLAEVNNPNVANLLEVNEDAGVHYIAMEYVSGTNLRKLLARKGRFPERAALSTLAGVARALVDAHRQGIIHRDIKPENIAMVGDPFEDEMETSGPSLLDLPRRVKLLDFGLARHVEQSESVLLTQTGALLGTPLYMAPEQCTGSSAVDPRTDVYAMGVTLFQLLSGRTPFESNNTMKMVAMHCNDPPPSLHQLDKRLSDGVVRLVDKALAKHPDGRYPDAGALLEEIERLLRGEASDISVHPVLPHHNPEKLFRVDWEWQLAASPEVLWPYVSNTERLNRAAGLPPVEYKTEVDPVRGARRFGVFRLAGLKIAWEEHPYEWIEGQRMGILREFSQGPFRWFLSVVELSPRLGGGTLLRHRVRIEPRGLLGRLVAAMEVSLKGRRSLDRIYRRIDAVTTGKLGSRPALDPFENPEILSQVRRQRLGERLERLADHNVDPVLAEDLGEIIAQSPAQEIARIRPLALAERLGRDRPEVVEACLRAVQEGLLLLYWDILCPTCRIASETKDTLRAIAEHGHCEVCNLDFELDFANSIEMILRVAPDLREAALGKYCIGGPEHSPHVVAQIRAGADEKVEMQLDLTEGEYLIRGPQLPQSISFQVQPGRKIGRWQITLAPGLDADQVPPLKTGRQVLTIVNGYDREMIIRVERTIPRDDVLTAAQACSLALFRELFPGEVLSQGQLARVATVTFLVTELENSEALYRDLGDARAFVVLEQHFRTLSERIRREGGAVIKTVGEGILAVFDQPEAAVRAALEFRADLARSDQTRSPAIKVGIVRGTAMAATLNDRLDYFGAIVHQAFQLPRAARSGELLLSQRVAADPLVAMLLKQNSLEPEIFRLDTAQSGDELLHRLTLPCADVATSK